MKSVSVTSSLSTLSGTSSSYSSNDTRLREKPLPPLPSKSALIDYDASEDTPDSGMGGDSDSSEQTTKDSTFERRNYNGTFLNGDGLKADDQNKKVQLEDAFERKDIWNWTAENVAAWLDSLNLTEYRRGFLDSGVTGKQLLDFDRSDFTRLGVTRIAHRQLIERSIKALVEAANNF
ncbi:unnamed protein product [Anisakis simplex]|uniref:SAM domain-containing protein n=1 Tax=Anisakis simplex TaxID=6269 RepID=A0A0M3K7N3_ANISI|nr:unnamed protein product [Anisakis simplex]